MSDERAVAEVVGPDRDRRHMDALRRAERRERIAEAIYTRMIYQASQEHDPDYRGIASDAFDMAEAFMREQDRREAADRSEK